METEPVSKSLIGRPGAWKCKAVELQLEKFAMQNRRRTLRLENMMRHNQRQAEKQQRIDTSWNNKLKKRESSRSKREQKRSAEKKRKEAIHAQHAEAKADHGKEINDSKIAFVEKHRKNAEIRDEKIRERKEKSRQVAASRAREKQEKRQQRLQSVRLAKEQKQADLRMRWEEKEQRKEKHREEEQEKRTIAKVARDLLTQTKRDRALQARQETLGSRRQKTMDKMEKLYKKADLLEQIEYATNEELKEISRLQWIKKQSMLKPKQETPGPGHYFGGETPSISKHRENEKTEDRNKQVKADRFPSLSEARSRLKALITPIITEHTDAWSIKPKPEGGRKKLSLTPKGSLPQVSTPRTKVSSLSPKGSSKAMLPNVARLSSFK